MRDLAARITASPAPQSTQPAAPTPVVAAPVTQASAPAAPGGTGGGEFGVEVGVATAGKPSPAQGAEFGQP
jgi:hypothetical protein